MSAENLLLFSPEEIPQTDPARLKPRSSNDIGKHMKEFMEEMSEEDRPVTLAVIERETGIPMSTLFQWQEGLVVPLADENLKKLAMFFRTSTDYLCFGIGLEHPYQDLNEFSA